jgi:hypothetical protein
VGAVAEIIRQRITNEKRSQGRFSFWGIAFALRDVRRIKWQRAEKSPGRGQGFLS